MPLSHPLCVAKALDPGSPLARRVSFEGLEHFVGAALGLIKQAFEDAKLAGRLQIDIALLPAGDSIVESQCPELPEHALSALEQRIDGLKRPRVRLPVAVSLLCSGSGTEDNPPWRSHFPKLLNGRSVHTLDELLCQRAGVANVDDTLGADGAPTTPGSFLSRCWRRIRDFLGFSSSQPCPTCAAFDQGCTESNADEWLAALDNHIKENAHCAGSLDRRGRLHLDRGAFRAAIDDLTRSIQCGGETADRLRDRAKAYLGLEEPRTALVDLNHGLAKFPNDVELLTNRAWLNAHLEDWEQASRDYDRAIQYEPLSPRLRVAAAQTFASNGNQDRAVEELSTAVALDPYHEPAYRLRAILRMLRGVEPERRQALADFSEAIELEPQNSISLFYRAQLRAGFGDPDGACADCDQALAIDPSLVGAYAIRSELRCRLNDFQGAIDDATRVLEQQASASMYVVRGQAWFGLPDIERAAEDFRTALELDAEDSQAHHALGVVHLHCDDVDDAYEAFSRAIKLRPQWAQPYLERGNCSRRRGEAEAAEGDYNEAIRLDPELVSALVNRGLILAEQGNLDAALADFSAAAELEPDDSQIRLFRGKCLLAQGEAKAAIEEFSRCLEIDPEQTEALIDRAKAHLHVKAFRAAIDDFSAALEQAPSLTSAYFGRSMAWMHLGEDAKADEDFREAVACDPGEAENLRFSRLLNEAMLRHKQERFEEVIECCNEALELATEDAGSALGIRAAAHWYSDQLVEAAEDFTRLLELHEDSHEALNGRGQVYAEMGEYQLALADLDRAIQLVKSQELPDATMAYALNGRGLAKAGLERFDEAIDDFGQSIVLCPGNAWVFYNLGLAYHQRQQSMKAATCLKLSLRLDDPALTPRKRRRASSYLETIRIDV